MNKMNQNDLSGEKDYTNLKGVLKKYSDAYQKCKDNKNNNKNSKNSDEDDDGAIYKINFNNALETFIDSFGKTFDNETLFEKVYLYIKQLFSSYCETLTLNLDVRMIEKIYLPK